MISPAYYYNIYLTVATILCLFTFTQYGRKKAYSISRQSSKGTFLLMLFYVLFIGLRPTTGAGIGTYFVDSANYIHAYNNFVDLPFSFSFYANNIIFENWFKWWASNDLGISSFFLLCALLYFGCAYWAINKLFKAHTLAAFLVFLTAFSAFSASVNAIKAGVAGSVFLLAIAYRDNLKVSVPLVLMSYGFHHSMQILVAAYVLCLFYNKPKFYYFFWMFSLLMAAGHVTFFQTLFAGFTDEKGADYLLSTGSDWGGKSGFRMDFVIYGAMPLLMGWYALKKKHIEDKLYNIILCTYIFSNAIWLLCMYAEFTNRIAYLSWFMYPIVLIYPLFLEEWGRGRYKTFAKVAGAHLAFTLFMHLIYY